MNFHSSVFAARPAAIAIFSNSQTDALKKFSAPLTEVSGQSCISHHLNDDEDVAQSPLVLVDCHCYSARRIQSWLTVKSSDYLPPWPFTMPAREVATRACWSGPACVASFTAILSSIC